MVTFIIYQNVHLLLDDIMVVAIVGDRRYLGGPWAHRILFKFFNRESVIGSFSWNCGFISENEDNVLLCITNLTTCCWSINGSVIGKWSFPNGTGVSSEFVSKKSWHKWDVLLWDAGFNGDTGKGWIHGIFLRYFDRINYQHWHGKLNLSYTLLEWSLPGTSCSWFKIQLSEPMA